jgi:hypothetical protein
MTKRMCSNSMENNEQPVISYTIQEILNHYNALVQTVNENSQLKAVLQEYKKLVDELRTEKIEEVVEDGEQVKRRKR